MNRPLVFIPALPPIDDLRAEPWLDRAIDLALAFYRDMSPEDDSSLTLDMTIIYAAAHVLWRHSGGNPCWSKLDVDACLTQFSRLPGWEQLGEQSVMTLWAFYCFLAKFGYLTSEQAGAVVAQLAPYAQPVLQRYAYQLFPLVDCERNFN